MAIPDGIYTLDRLEAAIQQATMANGDTKRLFGFLMEGVRVSVSIAFTGFQVQLNTGSQERKAPRRAPFPINRIRVPFN